MKMTKQDDGTYLLEMEPEDASESELQDRLSTIIELAKHMEKHGTDAARRKADRQDYWRYCSAEKSLNLIISLAQESLRHIKWLDFPERREVQRGTDRIQ